MTTVFTVGHSNHTPDTFAALLRLHRINAIADVRSSPYSRFAPQFNKDVIAGLLSGNRIVYVFLGNYLGARPNDPFCYRNGAINFSRLCQMDYFQEGLDRVRKGAAQYNLALLCTEKDPIQCHRMILVCRHLRAKDTVIKHILENGDLGGVGVHELGETPAGLLDGPEPLILVPAISLLFFGVLPDHPSGEMRQGTFVGQIEKKVLLGDGEVRPHGLPIHGTALSWKPAQPGLPTERA